MSDSPKSGTGKMVGEIARVSGPLVIAKGLPDPKMYDLVRVGEERLMGEVIELRGDAVSIQVYEETQGLGPGDPVYPTGGALSVELGPGLLESVFDGVQRPLDLIMSQEGNFLTRGVDLPGLDRERRWAFKPTCKAGDEVSVGDIIGTVQETSVIEHRIMVPHGVSGTIVEVNEGEFTVTDTVAVIEAGDGSTSEVTMMQRWPVRMSRPFRGKTAPHEPLITGQRVIDTFFPVPKGGCACVPGPFGSGKTVIQHAIAKWANADIVLFIGCGERGNEMTDVLLEFPELIDPYSGEPLTRRTVLVANTSNMPVAAREASIYTGMTIAEYYRDMGYNVVLQADSTSRWAEALREISGRLEEMPGEEGYPAYLGTRIASFYERAGTVRCECTEEREGSVTVVGSVSPPGGDISEPVTQATLRVVKVFWGLEDKLAFARHFPAINWLNSYSLYLDRIEEAWTESIGSDFVELRRDAMKVLQREGELEEMVRLVGIEALSPQERLIMENARSVREDYLQQNAFDDVDAYTSLAKQRLLLDMVMTYYAEAEKALDEGAKVTDLIALPIKGKIAQAKYTPESEIKGLESIHDEIVAEIREAAEKATAAEGVAQ